MRKGRACENHRPLIAGMGMEEVESYSVHHSMRMQAHHHRPPLPTVGLIATSYPCRSDGLNHGVAVPDDNCGEF